MTKIIAAVAIIGAAVWAYFAFDLGMYFTLEGMQNALGDLHAWRDDNYLLAVGVFMAVYIISVAVSMPGAAVLTPLAGALFGLWQGLVIVSLASTIGALLAMLATRYLLRGWIERTFASKVAAINEGVEKDGAFYLLTLRLVPVFPFFLINMAMGLTRMKAWNYTWVSMLGMLPGTFVYVNAGTQLAELESLSDVASPALWASIAALALLPWIAKGLVSVIKNRRLCKGYSKPKSFDANLVVIGAGAAGLVSSYIAATVKAKVILVEGNEMGGDCLNYGCVPSKALITSARAAHIMNHADRYGLEDCQVSPKPHPLAAVATDSASTDAVLHQVTPPSPHGVDMRPIMRRVLGAVEAIAPHDSIERYEGLGVDVRQGWATIVDPWTVEIAAKDGSTQRVTARSIVIAAGAAPVVPPLPGLEEAGCLTSDTLWHTLAKREEPLKSLVVLGGGPIGCELAQSFARLGVSVTQVEMGDRLLAREDEDVSAEALHTLTADGVDVRLGTTALRVEQGQRGYELVVEKDGVQERLPYDELLCAVGRKARLTGYGLEALGVDTVRTVATDEFLRTSIPNIYAAGDVAGPYQFTHTASHQAWYASVNALFGFVKKFKADYRVIPAATYTAPEMARVGLNEREAAKQGIDVEVTRYDVSDLDRAITESAARGFVKVLTPPGKDKILGVTIVADHAGEMLAEYVLAMKHGLGLSKILGTIHTYPTWSEANKYAAGEWKRAHAPVKVLELVQRVHSWRRVGLKGLFAQPESPAADRHSTDTDADGVRDDAERAA